MTRWIVTMEVKIEVKADNRAEARQEALNLMIASPVDEDRPDVEVLAIEKVNEEEEK